MKSLIPSRNVRDLVEKTGRIFSDFEIAGLIYNGMQPQFKKMEMLKKLSESTKDSALKKMLEQRIAWEEEEIECFKNNMTGYIYVLYMIISGEKHPISYFLDVNLAYFYGLRLRTNFTINKFEIIQCKEKYSAWEGYVASIDYDVNGEILNVSSCEVKRDFDEQYDMCWNRNRFEYAYFYIPNPFELGDIVNCLIYNKYCVVATSRTERETCANIMKQTTEKDFSDGSIKVYYFLEHGQLWWEYINPIFLEKVELTENDMDREMLHAISDLLKGGKEEEYLCRAVRNSVEQIDEKLKVLID